MISAIPDGARRLPLRRVTIRIPRHDSGDRQLAVAVVSKARKQRRKFDVAARLLGRNARRCSLVPVVDGDMDCLSANCEQYRAENPIPEPDHRIYRPALADVMESGRRAAASFLSSATAQPRLAGGTWE